MVVLERIVVIVTLFGSDPEVELIFVLFVIVDDDCDDSGDGDNDDDNNDNDGGVDDDNDDDNDDDGGEGGDGGDDAVNLFKYSSVGVIEFENDIISLVVESPYVIRRNANDKHNTAYKRAIYLPTSFHIWQLFLHNEKKTTMKDNELDLLHQAARNKCHCRVKSRLKEHSVMLLVC